MADPTYTALTTLAEVKKRLVNVGSGFDDTLNQLVTQISAEVEDALERYLGEQTFTEYHDGSGSRLLYLRQGPLVSVTSVESIEYGGTTTRTESATTIEQADRLEGGLRSEGAKGRAFIQMRGGSFVRGQRNYKIVYVAGWDTIPTTISKVALDLIVGSFKTREITGLELQSVGDQTTNPLTPNQRRQIILRDLGEYRLHNSHFGG